MKPLKVILCVPERNVDLQPMQKDVSRFVNKEQADLVIFPEGYLKDMEIEEAQEEVRKLAANIGTAVLTGIAASEGYEVSIFHNPSSAVGETANHTYVKHSSATRLAFELPEYRGKDDSMFDPIVLKGRKIGVMICHDMFFPLISHTLIRHGAEVLVDLTGGSVNYSKWSNIIRSKSIETGGAFLCTMGLTRGVHGTSTCIAYDRGRKIPFLIPQDGVLKPAEWLEPPGFAMIHLQADNLVEEPEDQSFSSCEYTDLTVSFGENKTADLQILCEDKQVRVINKGRRIVSGPDGWYKFTKKMGTAGLLILTLEKIDDSIAVIENMPRENINFHLVLYHGKNSSPYTPSQLLSLAKLRAIENRVGILVRTDELTEALKTTNYKNIQRFRMREGIYGFDLRNLGGPDSVFTASGDSGINTRFKENYYGLL